MRLLYERRRLDKSDRGLPRPAQVWAFIRPRIAADRPTERRTFLLIACTSTPNTITGCFAACFVFTQRPKAWWSFRERQIRTKSDATADTGKSRDQHPNFAYQRSAELAVSDHCPGIPEGKKGGIRAVCH